MPHTHPSPDACLRAALAAIARARPGAGFAALILALLLRLLARLDPAWTLSDLDEYDEYDDEYDDGYAAPRWAGAGAYAIVMPPMGRAPHAACIEAGLAPDWVLPGVINRGMRASAAPARPRPHTLPARAPPSEPPLLC